MKNGDFESSLTSWSIPSGTVEIVDNSVLNAASGSKSLELNGVNTGTLSQNVDLDPSWTYSLSFQLSGNPNYQGLHAIRVSIGDTSRDFTFAPNGNALNNMKYVLVGFDFYTSSPSPTLTFQSLVSGTLGPMIDNIIISKMSMFSFFHLVFPFESSNFVSIFIDFNSLLSLHLFYRLLFTKSN